MSQNTEAVVSSDSIRTAISGKFFTISRNNLAGTTDSPCSSTRAGQVTLIESSKLVVCKVRVPSSALRYTPARIESVERVEEPFAHTDRAF